MTDYDSNFRNTAFIIHDIALPFTPFSILIDKKHKELDKYLSSSNQVSWGFITAWNPLPRILDIKENRTRNYNLWKDIKALSLEPYRAEGRSLDSPWAEESHFVPGISKDDLLILSKKYEQVAVVYGEINSKAELIYI